MKSALAIILLAGFARAEDSIALLSRREPLAIQGIRCLTAAPKVGQTCELRADIGCTFDDPFNPADVLVTAHIATPSREYAMPGFYYVPFARQNDAVTAAPPASRGAPCDKWRARFLPTEPGRYRVEIEVKDRTGDLRSKPITVQVAAGKWPGLMRVSQKNPLGLERGSGLPFYALGVNIFDWTALGKPLPANRTDRCIGQIERLARAGGNFIRLRMDSWWFAIDNPQDAASGYLGAGRFNPRACWDTDRLFETCERHGIQVMLCLENANANVNSPREEWRRRYNAYAKENGGPCEKMSDFWTSEAAKDLMRRKIRYGVARWGASPSLAMWEFFNEVVLADDAAAEPVIAWHGEMAREFKRLDPYGHLVTTSSMSKDAASSARLWAVPGLDVAQAHDYTRLNTFEIYHTAQDGALACKKPFLVGEFGVSEAEPWSGRFKYAQDTEGLAAHLAHWSSAMSLGAGAALDWYVSGYVDAKNLWSDFARLNAFVADLPRTDPTLSPVTVGEVTVRPRGSLAAPEDVVLAPQARWEKSPCARYVLQDDGKLSPPTGLNGYLWGVRNHPDLRQPPTFVVKFPKPGRFIAHVMEVVGRGPNPVRIMLDGAVALEEDLVCEEGRGEKWEARQPGPTGNLAIIYKRDLVVNVPAGEHQIQIENLGRDRLTVEYRFEGYATRERTPDVMVVGLKHSGGAHIWLCNQTWSGEAIIGRVRTVPAYDVRATLDGLTDGPAELEWWSPMSGEKLRVEESNIRDGRLVLSIPELARDLACKVRYTPITRNKVESPRN